MSTISLRLPETLHKAARASRKKFLNALSKVPHAEPEEYDRLPAKSSKSTRRTL
jgi:hypothetical protein